MFAQNSVYSLKNFALAVSKVPLIFLGEFGLSLMLA